MTMRLAVKLASGWALVVAVACLPPPRGEAPDENRIIGGGPGHTPIVPMAPVIPPAVNDVQPRDYSGLHNVVAFHDGFYSGSVPEGDAGFDTITAMGVRTIISVDGA